MATLFSKRLSQQEVRRRVGDPSQLGGVRESVLQGGRSAGVRALDISTGGGLTFTVLPDRCLDIGSASYEGASLCWHSPAGIVHPAYYEPAGEGWLWSFFGGLLTTCGLTQTGPPNQDAGEMLGEHGRIANAPAEEVRYGSSWQDDELSFWVEGSVREARLFGPNLRLHRRISAQLGGRTIQLDDEVTNLGFAPSPLMLLYHCNAGYPLLDEGAELVVGNGDVQPRDAQAQVGLADWSRMPGPQPGWKEQVFYHTPKPRADGWCTAALINRQFDNGRGLGMALHWRQDRLPYLAQWKMVGEGAYVLGLEPTNCLVEGRHAEREAGRLQFIGPGEHRTFSLRFEVLPDTAAIEGWTAQLR